jgi:4-alpha-glucanotransferase
MSYKRSGGIILHPTSFPGPDGIGDLGPEAFRWIDCLKKSGATLWQILPLGPTGYGDSPYQSFSAFAGNPYLVSPTRLLDEGLLTRLDILDRPAFPQAFVDYGPVIQWKLCLLDRAYTHFINSASSTQRSDFERFQEIHASWLPDFSLFMAIKESQGGHPWNEWPMPLRTRKPKAISAFCREQAEAVDRHNFRQYLFFRQWEALRGYAARQGISLIGDAPIFVAYDCADVWSHPELFHLNRKGNPKLVAGVPPDYFSPTGQLWGNPLYRWDVHTETGYAWWIARLKAVLGMVDIIRLDHFRGFAGYWEIPAGKPTAEIGRWVQGPGAHFFSSIKIAISDLPIIAEDLGEITPDVVELRERYSLPGMRILQFAFSTDPDDPFLPHNYPVNCVAYTGTHDNDTCLGWYQSAPEIEKDFCRRYLARPGSDISWDMIRAVWKSVAMMALAPMQDFLSLGTDARMNFPGRASGNWTWRMPVSAYDHPWINRLKDLNWLFSRAPQTGKNPERPDRDRKLY